MADTPQLCADSPCHRVPPSSRHYAERLSLTSVQTVCILLGSNAGWTPFSKACEEDEPRLCHVGCSLLKSAHSVHTSPRAAPSWAQHTRMAGHADEPAVLGGEPEARASWLGAGVFAMHLTW